MKKFLHKLFRLKCKDHHWNTVSRTGNKYSVKCVTCNKIKVETRNKLIKNHKYDPVKLINL